MPVFLSYSHSDKDFAHKLAAHLVKNNAYVWVDEWELNVGDSIVERIQKAIEGSSALLVILSKASVQSEWCKRELSAGLVRELEEKRVIVLPVLLEDCDIPLFLRDKKYADFRTNFDDGLRLLVDAIARITNMNQGRLEEPDGETDWAVDWRFEDSKFKMHFTVIHMPRSAAMSLLTQVDLICNDVVTARYRQFVNAGLDWFGRLTMVEGFVDLAAEKSLKVTLEDSFPESLYMRFVDSKRGASYDIHATCRRLGEDNGKIQLVDVGQYLVGIRDWMCHIARRPSKEEMEVITAIISKPW